MADAIPSQKSLVRVIQGVHEDLRYRVQKDRESYLEVWNDHCNDPDRFRYAGAMHSLATEVWTAKPSENDRISILNKIIEDYFKGGGFGRIIRRMIRKYGGDADLVIEEPQSERLKVLDVGSCYNPFAKFGHDVTAIDISPASSDVLLCDFLNVPVGRKHRLDDSTGSIERLPANYFDAVIFCLLLEYLPDCRLRLRAVHKAFRTLRDNGILVIATPDSKHQQKNMTMIMSWKKTISAMGFDRVAYSKHEHLHCMAFRKLCPISRRLMSFEDPCGAHDLGELCSDCIEELSPSMFIHQDKHDYITQFEKCTIVEPHDDHLNRQLLDELPVACDI